MLEFLKKCRGFFSAALVQRGFGWILGHLSIEHGKANFSKLSPSISQILPQVVGKRISEDGAAFLSR